MNGGASWRKITSLTIDEGSIIWSTPDVTSQICLLKIEDAGDHTTSVLIDDMFTIDPPPDFFMADIADLDPKNTPFELID